MITDKKIAVIQYVIPKEIDTEAKMDALLEIAEIGTVYKYVGTTGKYQNGAIYIVEEV